MSYITSVSTTVKLEFSRILKYLLCYYSFVLHVSYFMFSIISILYFFECFFSYIRLDCFLFLYYIVSSQFCTMKTEVSIEILLQCFVLCLICIQSCYKYIYFCAAKNKSYSLQLQPLSFKFLMQHFILLLSCPNNYQQIYSIGYINLLKTVYT